MKKFFFLVAAIIAIATSSAKAQINNGESYQSVRVSYCNLDFKTSPKSDLKAINSGGVSYIKGWVSNHSIPLFFETGVGLSYAKGQIFNSEDYYTKYNLEAFALSAEVPLNLGVKLDFNENLSVMPYAGLTARFNFVGEIEAKTRTRYEEDKADEDLRTLQYGWQTGFMVVYDNISIGASYGVDFNDIYRESFVDAKAKSIKLSVGFIF